MLTHGGSVSTRQSQVAISLTLMSCVHGLLVGLCALEGVPTWHENGEVPHPVKVQPRPYATGLDAPIAFATEGTLGTRCPHTTSCDRHPKACRSGRRTSWCRRSNCRSADRFLSPRPPSPTQTGYSPEARPSRATRF